MVHSMLLLIMIRRIRLVRRSMRWIIRILKERRFLFLWREKEGEEEEEGVEEGGEEEEEALVMEALENVVDLDLEGVGEVEEEEVEEVEAEGVEEEIKVLPLCSLSQRIN